MKRLYLILLLLTGLNICQAQDFTASLSQSTVALGEQFQLSFTLNSSGSRFQPPSLPDFHVLSGPNQSTSMQFINGNVSQSLTFSYILQAKGEGTFKIGPATIEAGGKKVQSNPLTVKVVKGNPQSQRGAQGDNSGAAQADIGDNMFLRVSVNKSTVHQGEEIAATFKLYFRISVVSYSLEKLPVLSGFWTQDIEMPRQPDIRKEIIDGVQYNVAEIKKILLYPQQSGNLEIQPMEAQTVVRQQTKRRGSSHDVFDQLFNDPFFGGGVQDVSYKVKSNSVKINVRPLPQGQPEGFSGAVGRFSMESFIDKPQTKANDPVTLKIKINGRGNIKLIDPPKLNFPPDIESYDPKISDNISVNASGISGTRTFEYLLIPRHAGEFKLDPVIFSYFDLDKKDYVSVRSPEFRIKVEKGSHTGASATAVTGISKEDVQLLGKDIRYIKTGKVSFRQVEEPAFFGTPLFYSLLISPLLLFALFLGYYRKNKELSSNLALMKSRRANKIARQRLSAAKGFLQQNKKEEFYDAIFKALWGYASDRLGIPLSQLSKASAAEALSRKNVGPDLTDKFTLTLDNAEFARFAPGAASEMQSMYDSTIELISKIEEEIK